MEKEFHSKDYFNEVYANLDEFAEQVSTLIGCPITIEDSSHQLLAYSTHSDITDEARILTIMGRRVPEKVINALWKEGTIPALLGSSEPIIIPPKQLIGLGKRVAISIRKNENVLGFIWAALNSESDLTAEELNILKLAAKEAKNQLLLVQSRRKRKEESYQEFYWKLLTGHYASEKELRTQLACFSFVLPHQYCIIVFQFEQVITADTEKHIQYLVNTTQKVNTIFQTVDSDKFILMGDSSTPDSSQAISSFIKSFIDNMQERFGIPVAAGGFGRSCSQLIDAQISYMEAIRVINLKKRYKQELAAIFDYNLLGIYQYLETLHKQHSSQHQLPEGLRILNEYDLKHQTDLFYTLETFLTEPNEAASLLHIHSNTLSYRLRRISEISGYDLKDTNIRAYLLIEFKLARFE
ncbi:PucR family transcriptional regulator [Gracilibacillus sp. Marseille-QA3620]